MKLSFDGKGINDKSKEYSPRIATFTSDSMAKEYGTLFENAAELLECLKELTKRCDNEQGITNDGSNIQTIWANTLINKIESE